MNIFPHKHNFLTTEDSFLFYITYKEVVKRFCLYHTFCIFYRFGGFYLTILKD